MPLQHLVTSIVMMLQTVSLHAANVLKEGKRYRNLLTKSIAAGLIGSVK